MDDGADTKILKRAAGGDRAAFGEIYKLYYRRVFGYCCRMLADRDAAQDTVQTVFTKAMESIKSLEKPESFHYWLLSIARNEIYAALRARRKNETLPLEDEAWDMFTPLESAVKHETTALVESALNRLKTEYREVLVLRHYWGLSYADIAAVTGDTISSVESRLFKARKAIIKYLEPFMQERNIQ